MRTSQPHIESPTLIPFAGLSRASPPKSPRPTRTASLTASSPSARNFLPWHRLPSKSAGTCARSLPRFETPLVGPSQSKTPNLTRSQTQSEILLSRILEKAIRRSSALDTESLCIVAGAKCFSIRADIHVLSHDGGLVDASCIAVVAALQHFRRPDVSIEGENVIVYSVREREPVPLSMLHQPFCITFSYFEDGEVVVVDADLAEERVREGEVVVTMNRHGEVCQIVKYGGATVDALSLLNCTNVALGKVKEIDGLVRRRLEEERKRKDAGGLMAELSAENERDIKVV